MVFGGFLGSLGSASEGLGKRSRTRIGAMDWTALQRVSLALTSGALIVLQSRAPASNKVCTHGSFSTDAAALLRIQHVVVRTL